MPKPSLQALWANVVATLVAFAVLGRLKLSLRGPSVMRSPIFAIALVTLVALRLNVESPADQSAG